MLVCTPCLRRYRLVQPARLIEGFVGAGVLHMVDESCGKYARAWWHILLITHLEYSSL